MLRDAACLTLALVGALLVASAGEVAIGSGVAVLALVLALVVAGRSRRGVPVVGATAIRPPASAAPYPARSTEITDPRRHPLRPRAPGLA